MLRIVFDVPRLTAKRKELEQISAQPEFWVNQAEDGIRDLIRSRGLGDVYKRQILQISKKIFRN